MAKREPRQPRPCTHDIARWRAVGPEHQLRCDHCDERLAREFGTGERALGIALYRSSTGYAPFDPKGWML
jgi:hypothetical protein